MTLEKALIALGSDPLSKSAYSQAILTLVKATIGEKGEAITKDTLGYEVLGIIYRISNNDKRNTLLTYRLGRVRSTDGYRHAVVAASAIMVVFALMISLVEIMNEGPISGDYADVLKTVVLGFFEILKLLLTDPQTSLTPS
jgi:hypothetical protein